MAARFTARSARLAGYAAAMRGAMTPSDALPWSVLSGSQLGVAFRPDKKIAEEGRLPHAEAVRLRVLEDQRLLRAIAPIVERDQDFRGVSKLESRGLTRPDRSMSHALTNLRTQRVPVARLPHAPLPMVRVANTRPSHGGQAEGALEVKLQLVLDEGNGVHPVSSEPNELDCAVSYFDHTANRVHAAHLNEAEHATPGPRAYPSEYPGSARRRRRVQDSHPGHPRRRARPPRPRPPGSPPAAPLRPPRSRTTGAACASRRPRR